MRIKSNHFNQQQCSSANVTFWVGEDERLATDADCLTVVCTRRWMWCCELTQPPRGRSKIHNSWCGVRTGAGQVTALVFFDQKPTFQIYLTWRVVKFLCSHKATLLARHTASDSTTHMSKNFVFPGRKYRYSLFKGEHVNVCENLILNSFYL